MQAGKLGVDGFMETEWAADRKEFEALLQQESEREPPKGSKRGPKGYGDSELKPFEVKFYELLYENDVQVGVKIAVDDYAGTLVDWGERNKLKTPKRTKMSQQIEQWRSAWLEVKSLKK